MPNHDRLDIVSVEVAQKLQEAGFPWEPGLFDFFWNGEANNLLS